MTKEMKSNIGHFLKGLFWSLILGSFCILGFGTPLMQTIASNPEKPYELDYYIVDSLCLILFFVILLLLDVSVKNRVRFWGASFGLLTVMLLLIYYLHIGMFI